MIEHPASVVLVVSDGDRLVAVRQHRPGARGRLLELPAGTLEPGETPVECADRELAEECGLAVSEWTKLGSFWAAPAYSTEFVTVFAGVCSGVRAAEPDDDEDITVERIPAGEASALLQDGTSLAALALWAATPRTSGSGPFEVRRIGVVRSTLREVADAPNQAFEGGTEALLELDPAFADALNRIEPGDELILLTWLHLADRSVLQTHPRGDETNPLTGVFRTRSSQRPNPIGVHRVTVTALEGSATLRVAALEAIDGTPVIDLKVAMRESPDA